MSRSIYDQILLEHNLHPVHEVKECSGEKYYNSSCGDELTISLENKNGIITNGAFSGKGCAISKASADLMIDALKGKTMAEAKILKQNFEKMIIGELNDCDTEKNGELCALKCIARMPARANCAKLAWKVIK